MASNNSVNLVSLDFDTLANSLKAFLQSQNVFKDYDFDGSNMSVLIDLLARNSSLLAFYLNMVGAEGWIDSCQLLDSMVSHAKELNYLPQSFRSAIADIDVIITPANTARPYITIPSGTSFTSKVGSNNFTFVTNNNLVVVNSNGVFNANNLLIYEGPYFNDTFVINYSIENQRFILSNPTIDTTSLSVASIENSGANTILYSFTSSVYDLNANSTIYFLQACEGNRYEIVFGDGVIGRIPLNGATIIAQYRVCNGELPNGASNFTPDGPIDGEPNVSVTTNSPAVSGAVSESIDSIRFNAPRAFTTQNRAINLTDYEILLQQNFPEISAIHAYDGGSLSPPQFGKVFIPLQISGFAGIPDSKVIQYTNFIKNKNTTSITPVFQNPNFLYVRINSTVNYNENSTPLTPVEIETLVKSTILSYNQTNLTNFDIILYESPLCTAIDNTDQSIVSNDTEFSMMQKINPIPLTSASFILNYNNSFLLQSPETRNPFPTSITRTITSTQFIYGGKTCSLMDDGNGNLNIINTLSDGNHIVTKIGTVDYINGVVTLANFNIQSYFGDSVRIYAIPAQDQIQASQNYILTIAQDEIFVNALGINASGRTLS